MGGGNGGDKAYEKIEVPAGPGKKEEETGKMLKGIDVSKWQKGIDWKAVKVDWDKWNALAPQREASSYVSEAYRDYEHREFDYVEMEEAWLAGHAAATAALRERLEGVRGGVERAKNFMEAVAGQTVFAQLREPGNFPELEAARKALAELSAILEGR
jgi:hypothetical protein